MGILGPSAGLTISAESPSWYQIGGDGPSGPGARLLASMTYDASDGYLLLFGGSGHPGGSGFGDTWTYANGSWTQLKPGPAPSPRAGAAMAYDAADGYVVLFGGFTSGGDHPGVSSQTWKFVDGVWTALTPSNAPPARGGATMAYDAADQYLVLFGGSSGSRDLNDTWTFRGGVWTNATDASAPSPRMVPLSTYDGHDGNVLLFGGQDEFGSWLNDTWGFARGAWTALDVRGAPDLVAEGAMAFDPYSGSVVLFGGTSTGFSAGSTWAFAGTTWSRETTATAPGVRSEAAAALDASDGYLVMFGGAADFGTYKDTWTWEAPLLYGNASADTVYVGQNVLFSASARAPASGVRLTWSSLSSALSCSSAGTTFDCDAIVPGTYHVSVNATDGSGAWTVGTLALNVVAYPTVGTPVPSTGGVDVGGFFELNATATGGIGAYLWSWSGLPGTCTGIASPAVACRADLPGPLSISASVTDADGRSAQSEPATIWIYPDPAVASPVAEPSVVDVGQSFNLSTTAAGGLAPYTWHWMGLPQNCSTAGSANVQCHAVAPGRLSLVASIEDMTGTTANSTAVLVDVYAPPAAQLSVEPGTSIARGTGLSIVATVAHGAGDLQYVWTAGRLGCGPSAGPYLNCTPTYVGSFTLALTVTDRANGTSSVHVKVTVTALPGKTGKSGGAPASPPISLFDLAVLALAAIAVVTAVAALLLRRPGRPAAPVGPNERAPDAVARAPAETEEAWLAELEEDEGL